MARPYRSPLAEPLLKRSRNSPFLLRRNSEGSGSFTNTTSKQFQSAGGGSGPDMGGTASGGAGSTTSSGENRGSGESAGPVGAPGQPRGITAVPIPTGPSKCCSAGDHGKAAVDVCPPHGVLAVCGRRKEMEDAVATVPALLSVPCQGLLGCQTPPPAAAPDADPAAAAGDTAGGSTCQLHFFAVYDGHGGSQVANFCSERLHLALAEELQLSLAGAPPSDGDGEREPESEHTMESHWRAAFLAAFTSVDAHVAGKCPRAGPCRGRGGGQPCEVEHEPLAPETVGTTAIVTASQTPEALPHVTEEYQPPTFLFSSDHSVRVALPAMVLCDRYLKPYVIAEPEVTFTRRSPDDECMILASDGLWDVISSQEACEFVLKVFQQKSAESQQEQAAGADAGAAPAGGSPSSVAASALTKLALTRGSGDNISVVVVDLRPPAAAAAAAAAEAE
eukprot:jgi/Mesen1/943/ME000118S00130